MYLLKVLLRYSPKMVFWSILAGGISGAASAGLIALVNRSFSTPDPAASRWLLWSFVGLCAVVPLSRFASGLLLLKLGQKVVLDLRMRLSRRILAAPMRRLEELGAHRLLAALTEDLGTIVSAVVIMPMLCVNVALFLGCLVYMASLSWRLFLLVFVAIIVGAISYQLPMLKSMQLLRTGRELRDSLHDFFKAITQGTKELQMHQGRQGAFLDELEATGQTLRQLTVKSLAVFTAAISWGQFLLFAIIGLIVFGGVSLFGAEGSTITGYTLVALYLLAPLEGLLQTMPDLGRASVSIAKVETLGFSLLDKDPEKESARLALPASRGEWQQLELRGLRHAYRGESPDDEFILGPIDLTFRQGEIVFLTGGNGSGKTTFAKLLVGLYASDEGEIALDGEKITAENLPWYRQHFSTVFYDFYLFKSLLGLVGGNLDSQARDYIERLHLGEKVTIEEGKLSTLDLSQGQRKRLALLTAYLEDRGIYLFDEWAADQDPHFRELFYRDLLADLKARGKTVFVISHDDRYYDVADRLIKLDYGKVVVDRRKQAAAQPVEARQEVGLG